MLERKGHDFNHQEQSFDMLCTPNDWFLCEMQHWAEIGYIKFNLRERQPPKANTKATSQKFLRNSWFENFGKLQGKPYEMNFSL